MEIYDFLSKVTCIASKHGIEEGTARGERKWYTEIESEGERVRVHRGYEEGVSLRVLRAGGLGFASTTMVNENNINLLVKRAVKTSKLSSSRENSVGLATADIENCRVEAPCHEDPRHELEKKVEFIRKIVDELKVSDCYLKSVRVHYYDEWKENMIETLQGSTVGLNKVKVTMSVITSAFEKGKTVSFVSAFTQLGGLEFLREYPSDSIVCEVKRKTLDLLSASKIKSGQYKVILSPNLTGLLVHEVLGHMLEADNYLSGNILTGKIGEKIFPSSITLIDSPTYGKSIGWCPYDDEGVKGTEVKLIEEGVLKSCLHNRETASLLGVNSTGNARAQDFSYEPMVRMRNTFLKEGNMSIAELTEDIVNGLFLGCGLSGSVWPNGDFRFTSQECYTIENAEIKTRVHPLTIFGNVFETIGSIDGMGKVVEMFGDGCVKIQNVDVGMGGPHIKCWIRVIPV